MIAVDVMGGDLAPNASLEGALRAARKKVPILLCGPKDKIVTVLQELDGKWKSYHIEFYDTHEVIEMGEDPLVAVSQKQNSSLVGAVKNISSGVASACVSAGNSGALMAASVLMLGRVEGVDRPAIASFLPGRRRSTLCLDLGANTECKPAYLVHFAHLGVEYITKKFDIKNPRVGLLSNGSEASKGSALTKKAFDLLEQSGLNFVGNCEPYDIVKNKADVVVCDGFSGNILLKSFEAMAQEMLSWFSEEFEASDNETKKSAESAILHIKEKVDWRRQGGALLLGVRGTVVVAHGSSNADAIENAIHLAWKASRDQ
jgi:glycerol-3-phosphate acyltransferase PlsX